MGVLASMDRLLTFSSFVYIYLRGIFDWGSFDEPRRNCDFCGSAAQARELEFRKKRFWAPWLPKRYVLNFLLAKCALRARSPWAKYLLNIFSLRKIRFGLFPPKRRLLAISLANKKHFGRFLALQIYILNVRPVKKTELELSLCGKTSPTFSPVGRYASSPFSLKKMQF